MIYKIQIAALLLIAVTACKKNNDSASDVDLQKELKLYFPFNGKFTDSAEYAAVINFSSTNVKWVADRKAVPKNALFMDGGIASVLFANWKYDKVSVSLWLKRTGISYDNYFISVSSGVFGLSETGEQIRFAVSTSGINSVGTNLTTQWAHIVGTYDRAQISFYLNGELISTAKHQGQDPPPITTLVIGDVDNETWKGSIDELRIYNRILNAEEIKKLANE